MTLLKPIKLSIAAAPLILSFQGSPVSLESSMESLVFIPMIEESSGEIDPVGTGQANKPRARVAVAKSERAATLLHTASSIHQNLHTG